MTQLHPRLPALAVVLLLAAAPVASTPPAPPGPAKAPFPVAGEVSAVVALTVSVTAPPFGRRGWAHAHRLPGDGR